MMDFLIRKYVTSQHKDLTSQHNYLTSRHQDMTSRLNLKKSMPPYTIHIQLFQSQNIFLSRVFLRCYGHCLLVFMSDLIATIYPCPSYSMTLRELSCLRSGWFISENSKCIVYSIVNDSLTSLLSLTNKKIFWRGRPCVIV